MSTAAIWAVRNGRWRKPVLRPHGQKWDQASLVELPETWHEYWLGREPKFRKNVDRLQRRMAEQGKVEFIRCRGGAHSTGEVGPACRAGLDRLRDAPEPSTPAAVPCSVVHSGRTDLQAGTLADPYATCVALAQSSWQGEGGDKTNLCHDRFGDFFREAHAAAEPWDAADINLLCFDGQPAAFAYNYCWKGAVYGLRKGFDPRFAPLRPGLVLQKLMLEDGHRRGDRLYDLGTGDPSFQGSLADEPAIQLSLHVFSPPCLPRPVALVEPVAAAEVPRPAGHRLFDVADVR